MIEQLTQDVAQNGVAGDTDPATIAAGKIIRSVTIDGEDIPLGRFALREMGEFAEWANRWLPNPYESIRGMLESATAEDAKALRALAYEEARMGPKPFGDPAVMGMTQTTDGIREVFWLAARKADPSLARDRVDALADRIGMEQIGDILTAAFRLED